MQGAVGVLSGGGGTGTDPVVLRKHGGDGTAEAEALLGDKILDLMLYWRLMRQFDTKDEGRFTQLRSVYFSNETLATIGEEFVVPEYMAYHAWKRLSIHEKGTAVEAIIGKSFINNNILLEDLNHTTICRDTTSVTYKMIDSIGAFVTTIATSMNNHVRSQSRTDGPVECRNGTSPLPQSIGHKNPSQALQEWLQLDLKIKRPSDAISIRKLPDDQHHIAPQPKFVATFALPKELSYPAHIRGTNVVLQSEPCNNKRKARDDVCRLAVLHFNVDTSLTLASSSGSDGDLTLASSLPVQSAKIQKRCSEKPSIARLYEWLQIQGVTYPARTIKMSNVMSDGDVSLEYAFQGVFTLNHYIINGAKCATKRAAKDDIACKVLEYFDVGTTKN